MIDLTWITDRLAVGGGIWTPANMAEIVRNGVTHIVDMQVEFDDTPLAKDFPVIVLWNPTDDDFQLKPPEVLQRGVDFALQALDEPESKVFVHCAAGVHRAPMMTLAILGAMGWELGKAMDVIVTRRPCVDFAEVYVQSVKQFLREQVGAGW
jgi:protein-tyrosine phosphatase